MSMNRYLVCAIRNRDNAVCYVGERGFARYAVTAFNDDTTANLYDIDTATRLPIEAAVEVMERAARADPSTQWCDHFAIVLAPEFCK